MNVLLSLPQQSPKGDSFGKFCDCFVRSYKKLWWNHIAPVQSIKEARFMKLKAARPFVKDAIFLYQILPKSNILFLFNRINVFNLSV